MVAKLMKMAKLDENKPVVNLVTGAADAGSGQQGLESGKTGVASEKSLGGIVHSALFFWGDANQCGSLAVGVVAIFDFGKENLPIERRNQVNFVGFGLEIVGDNGVILRLKVLSDGIFGCLAFSAGRQRCRKMV